MHNGIRSYNIGIFENTMAKIKDDASLGKVINESISNQLFHLKPVDIKSIAPIYDDDCPVTVSRDRSIDSALRWKKANPSGKVAVLNFASATRPGGGVVTGSSAQEECICRCTTLYPCLTTMEADIRFYGPHRKNVGPLHNDDIIYTPNVAILRNDDYDWLQVPVFIDVITCAAPNLREKNISKYNQEREPAPDISPEQQAAAEERSSLNRFVPDAAFDAVSTAELKEIILALPEHYRSVMYLAGVYEYNQPEIASLLQLPVETVKKRMQRGRLLLQQALQERENENSRKKEVS